MKGVELGFSEMSHLNGFYQLRVTAHRKDGQPTESKVGVSDVKAEDIPGSFYVGQEFIEDPEKVEVIIRFSVHSSVTFEKFELNIREFHARQIENGEIICLVEKSISEKLFDIVKWKGENQMNINDLTNVTHLILGYIKNYIPKLNEEILRRKYLEAHILAKTFGMPDIRNIYIFNRRSNEAGIIVWPIPVSSFPHSKISSSEDAVFIRDLIDAMTSYFQYNFDDSFRKVITSLENCFSHYRLGTPKDNIWDKLLSLIKIRRLKIRKLISFYITPQFFPYKERDLKIIRDNILFIYKARNLIVHDRLRVGPKNDSICIKAIHTLLYIYQGSFVPKAHREYISTLNPQFLLLRETYSGVDLERIERAEKIEHEKERRGISKNIINTPDELNKMMFEGLKIINEEKNFLFEQDSDESRI